MRSRRVQSALFAGLLLVGTLGVAAAQTQKQSEDPHHPAQTQTEPAPAAPGETPAAGAPGGMPGMMTPQMMQMMQMMQNMMGQGGMGGMMGGMAGMAGEGMPKGGMGQGMMMCPMMQMMMGARAGMGGPGMHLGMPSGSQEEMTPERVRTFVEEHLTRQGNPRLKLGEVATAADGSITAEIVTVDGSLVQKLAFNRYPGLFRQVQ